MSNTIDSRSKIFSSIIFFAAEQFHYLLPSTAGLHLHTRQRSAGSMTFVGVFWLELSTSILPLNKFHMRKPEHVNTQIWQIPSHVRKPDIQYPIIIAVTQRNMEVRFLQRAPRGSLAFGFASTLVRAFGTPESEKTSGTRYCECRVQPHLIKVCICMQKHKVVLDSFMLQ